jgi:hypothetical protein
VHACRHKLYAGIITDGEHIDSGTAQEAGLGEQARYEPGMNYYPLVGSMHCNEVAQLEVRLIEIPEER